jgi:decaprenyl-phosphate phosphoribosyltransferase
MTTTGGDVPASELGIGREGEAVGAPVEGGVRGGVRDFVRLARPHQWAKSVFVLVGPLYHLQDGLRGGMEAIGPFLFHAFVAAGVFALASSGCYVVNDLLDAERDRAHPRKRHRPIASGRVSERGAIGFCLGMFVVAGLGLLLLPGGAAVWVGGIVAVYVANVMAYSFKLKHVVIADVMSLSLGFVLRVMAGCAAVAVTPSTWLLNATLFVAMLLAFGKRLGERRSAESAELAVRARGVQAIYSDSLLRMLVVVSAVASLLTYAGYVQAREGDYAVGGLNLLWFTLLPAMYAMLRAITLLERGRYDDPTELAIHDRPFQVAAAAFGLSTAGLVVARVVGVIGPVVEGGVGAG